MAATSRNYYLIFTAAVFMILSGCATDPMIVTVTDFKECSVRELKAIDDGKAAPETVAAAVIKRCDREQTAAIAPLLKHLDAPNQVRMTAGMKREYHNVMTLNVIGYRLRKEQRPHTL